MEKDMARIVIESAVHKALADIRDDSGRGIRNLVDMALQFSNKQFQREFFQSAQTMLKDEHSAYYALASDVATHVDERYLINFGVNVGYNGCVKGAQRIRQMEASLHCNIPWQLSLIVSLKSLLLHATDYERVIAEGNALGICCWYIFAKGCVKECLPLMSAHTDNAFAVFCRPEDITPEVLEEMAAAPHVMPMIDDVTGVDEACARLRSKAMLYSIAHTYTEADLRSICDGELLTDLETLHPVFTVFIPTRTCTAATLDEITHKVTELRGAQRYQTILFDLYGDSRTIDNIVSEDYCSLAFDEDGHTLLAEARAQTEEVNLFTQPLTEVLRAMFPKEAVAATP